MIKAWFGELPRGIMDSLPSEQVMQCQTEEECTELANRLPHIEASLLELTINLRADVVQEKPLSKMNAHNTVLVLAPSNS